MSKDRNKDVDFSKMEKVYTPRNKYVAKDFHVYLSYTARLFFMFAAILVIGVVSYMNYESSFSKSNDVEMVYKENAKIDYEVTLLPGNPFQSGNLNAVDSYISTYIDDIGIDFKYDYEVEYKSDIKYTYYVNTIMELKDDSNGAVLSRTVNYLITENTRAEDGVTKFPLTQNVTLDYDYYNKLAKAEANKLAKDSGIKVSGIIYVEMHIASETTNDKFKTVLTNAEVIKVEIPLMSTQVKAKVVNSINKTDKYTEHESAELVSKATLFVAISLWIVDIIFLLLVCNFITKSTPKKSTYQRIRNNLLKEHDNIIVNSKNDPNFKGYNVINCASFAELVDAQKVLGKPIIYNELVKNQKCMFVIINGNDVYRFVLKEADIVNFE